MVRSENECFKTVAQTARPKEAAMPMGVAKKMTTNCRLLEKRAIDSSVATPSSSSYKMGKLGEFTRQGALQSRHREDKEKSTTRLNDAYVTLANEISMIDAARLKKQMAARLLCEESPLRQQ